MATEGWSIERGGRLYKRDKAIEEGMPRLLEGSAAPAGAMFAKNRDDVANWVKEHLDKIGLGNDAPLTLTLNPYHRGRHGLVSVSVDTGERRLPRNWKAPTIGFPVRGLLTPRDGQVVKIGKPHFPVALGRAELLMCLAGNGAFLRIDEADGDRMPGRLYTGEECLVRGPGSVQAVMEMLDPTPDEEVEGATDMPEGIYVCYYETVGQ